MSKNIPIALLLLFLLSLWHAPPLRAGEVTLLINYPSISPNGDGVKDFLTATLIVDQPLDTLAVTMEDLSGTTVFDTIFFSAPAAAGSFSAVWDGTDSLNLPLGEGEYTLHLYEYAGVTGESVHRTIIIDLTPADITIDRIEPGVYAPGYPDTAAAVSIYYLVSGFNSGDMARAIVTDPKDLQEFIPLSVTADGAYSLKWKAKSNTGGIHTVELEIEDQAGNKTSDGGVFEVDTEGPSAEFNQQIPLKTRTVPEEITGYCHDPAGVSEVLLTWTQKIGGTTVESDRFAPHSTWMQNDTVYWLFETPD
ncbi:MAG: hypothetical protein JXB45_07700, partial [Candidatus Krumholzibacteriota bacterium]|nr:hypothetical protein [Candidatus Krumholzibacteriota bacterium]